MTTEAIKNGEELEEQGFTYSHSLDYLLAGYQGKAINDESLEEIIKNIRKSQKVRFTDEIKIGICVLDSELCDFDIYKYRYGVYIKAKNSNRKVLTKEEREKLINTSSEKDYIDTIAEELILLKGAELSKALCKSKNTEINDVGVDSSDGLSCDNCNADCKK